jgi:hypothetical protein
LPRALHDRIAELKGHICRGQARATYLLLHAASNSFTALSVASSAMQRARRTILDHKSAKTLVLLRNRYRPRAVQPVAPWLPPV